VEVQPWEVVAYRLPDRAAIADYLHAINVAGWDRKVDLLSAPLTITKLGAHVWARR
jgi:hypothetical protein